MALIPLFMNGEFKVVDDATNAIVLNQPFKPTSTGEQISWTDKVEAEAWWETQKLLFTHTEIVVPVEEPPVTE